MSIWTILSYAAWIISAALFLWMIIDAVSVGKKYDEDFLMSSREGEE